MLSTDKHTALLRHLRNVVTYLEKNGVRTAEQEATLLYAAEAWDKLNPNGVWDEELESRLRKRAGLWSVPAQLKPKAVSLKVPYWKQTDNYRDANRTCFSSSMAMIIEYLKPDELPNDDTYVKTVFSIGDTTDPNVQLQALARHGIQGTYRQNMSIADLNSELAQGYPVGIGILHRGPLDAPTGGHWIVCIGRNEDGSEYQFMDPYGSILDGYQGEVENGCKVWYKKGLLEKRWTVEGKNSGWGMTCRKK
jgi:hypothetical protein